MRINNLSSGHLSQHVFLILSCLESGSAHIVVLKQNIEQHSGDDLEPGTLYGALARLEQRGWVIALHGRDSLYQLTESGKEALENHRIALHKRQERVGVLAHGTSFKTRTTKESTMKLLTWIIKLYPQAWRARYETEMLAVLESHTVTLWTLFDLFFGAVDARLDPYYRTERTLFSFKNIQTATIAFIVFFLVALFCMMVCYLQSAPLGYGGGIEDSIAINGSFYLRLVLFASNVLVAIVAVKRAIAAKRIRIGIILLAAMCFVVIPFIILRPFASLLITLPLEILNGSIHGGGDIFTFTPLWYSFYVFAGLELLMGCLFLTIIKGITAIATHKKGPLLVCTFVAFMLILLEYWFYVYYFISLNDFTNSMSGLLPFAGAGALLLTVTTIKMNQRNLRIALVLASLLVLGITVNLLGTFLWTIFSWGDLVKAIGPWFFFDGRYPLMATVVLVFTTIFAIAALKYSFSMRNTLHNEDTENIQVEQAAQALPPQMQ
jgi:DNA-binding PadR family transcriptional regulator